MLAKNKYKIISVFLLLVFSLNTVAGFACSIGLDLGYNHHHHHDVDVELNTHHSHIQHLHNCSHDDHEQISAKDVICNAINDDCCSGAVTKFAQLDKSVVSNQFVLQPPTFLLAFSSIFFSNPQKQEVVIPQANFPLVRRSCFLHDTNIRIAIQSFQI